MAVDLVDLNAVLKAQVLEQRFKRLHLCAAVIELWAPFLADAAHQGYANASAVIALCVRASALVCASFLDCAITLDEVMVANVAPASSLMPSTNLCHADVLARPRSGAMNKDAVNFSQFFCLQRQIRTPLGLSGG